MIILFTIGNQRTQDRLKKKKPEESIFDKRKPQRWRERHIREEKREKSSIVSTVFIGEPHSGILNTSQIQRDRDLRILKKIMLKMEKSKSREI